MWGPFVSNEEPGPGSWDAEDRATIAAVAKGKLKKHVCGDKGGFLLSISANMKLIPFFHAQVFDAIAIDARRREDDVPWDETKEVITKNTPFFGFLCMQKNNDLVGYKCSDYKVRILGLMSPI